MIFWNEFFHLTHIIKCKSVIEAIPSKSNIRLVICYCQWQLSDFFKVNNASLDKTIPNIAKINCLMTLSLYKLVVKWVVSPDLAITYLKLFVNEQSLNDFWRLLSVFVLCYILLVRPTSGKRLVMYISTSMQNDLNNFCSYGFGDENGWLCHQHPSVTLV